MVIEAASIIGCATFQAPFRYLGVMVGGSMSRKISWNETIQKIQSRLSKWKIKTLSIGGRLTLLKSVLGSTPIYNMSLYKVSSGILHLMETIRSRFFNGSEGSEKRITWVSWKKVLTSKDYGGLGVSSFYALNRALMFKWVWRFLNEDNSMWYKLIKSIHGSCMEFQIHSISGSSTWLDILKEVHLLNQQGIDILSHCRKRVGNGENTSFWNDLWIGEQKLKEIYPRVFASEIDKLVTVAEKMSRPIIKNSNRRSVRAGSERNQEHELQSLLSNCTLAQVPDRWVWDLNGEGVFKVKDVRKLIDDFMLPKDDHPTRWVKYVPIKVNILAWKISMDRIATKTNLLHRGVQIQALECPICDSEMEDMSHLFFKCEVASTLFAKICTWWNLVWCNVSSYQEWLSWLKSIRMNAKLKVLLEGVFYSMWWHIWNLRNQILFGTSILRRSSVVDDLVARSFTWCSSRCNKKISWTTWIQNPSSISL